MSKRITLDQQAYYNALIAELRNSCAMARMGQQVWMVQEGHRLTLGQIHALAFEASASGQQLPRQAMSRANAYLVCGPRPDQAKQVGRIIVQECCNALHSHPGRGFRPYLKVHFRKERDTILVWDQAHIEAAHVDLVDMVRAIQVLYHNVEIWVAGHDRKAHKLEAHTDEEILEISYRAYLWGQPMTSKPFHTVVIMENEGPESGVFYYSNETKTPEDDLGSWFTGFPIPRQPIEVLVQDLHERWPGIKVYRSQDGQLQELAA